MNIEQLDRGNKILKQIKELKESKQDLVKTILNTLIIAMIAVFQFHLDKEKAVALPHLNLATKR